jgi:DNA-binding protein Fis
MTMLFALGCAAQSRAPKPFLQRTIEAGATELQGNYDPLGPGIAPGLRLYAAEKNSSEFRPVVAAFAVDFMKGVFTISLEQPVEAEQRLKVLISVGQSSNESDAVQVERKAETTKLTLLDGSALYGASKLTVVFKPPSKVVGKPTVCVQYTSHAFDAEIKDDQLKAGSAEIPLPSPLIDPWGPPSVTINSPPCDSITGSITFVPVAAAVQVVPLPLREGSTAITGTTDSSVQRVCLAVLGGAISAGDIPQLSHTSIMAPPRNCHEAMRTFRLAKTFVLLEKTKTPTTTVATIKTLRPATMQGLSQDVLDRLAEQPTDLLRDSVADLSGMVLMEMEAPVDEKTHTFKFDLDRPLEAGSKVLVRQVFPTAPGGVQVALAGPDPIVVDSSGLDLGRVRAFFTAGAAISQSSDSFGKADPYLAFSMDGNLFNMNLVSKRDPKRISGDDDNQILRDLFSNRSFGASIHWTVGARLTQTGSLTAQASSTPSLQSVQSSLLYAGLYAPLRVRGMDWVYRGTQFSSFFAPLAKVGVTAIKDGVVRSRTTSSTVTTLDPCPIADCSQFAKTVAADPKLSYANGPAPFYGLGFRVGVMKYDLLGSRLNSRQIAPDPIMYMDVTWGQNQAYVTPGTVAINTQTSADKLAGTLATTTTKVQGFTTDRRLAVEARLKIPYLPAEIGADVNLNKEAPLTPLVGADSKISFTDFRFFFGFRMDVAKVLSTVTGKK